MARSIGADHVVDYTTDDFTQSGQRYDVTLDTAGSRSLSSLRRALTPKGTLRFSVLMSNEADLIVLKELIEAAKVTPVIDRSYPLSENPLAGGHVDEGHAQA